MSEDDDSWVESVYNLLEAEEGMHHDLGRDERTERELEDLREEVFERNLDLYKQAIDSLQSKADEEWEENSVLVLYGLYDEGAVVAGVRPQQKETTGGEFYVNERWVNELAEQGLSHVEQVKRSEYGEELEEAIGMIKVGIPEGLENRAKRGLEDAFDELEDNPLTQRVHGNYIFPGDPESDIDQGY